MRISEALATACSRLRAASESPRLDAELLLARAIDMPRSFLYAHPDDDLDDASLERFVRTVERRLCGEPLAYICGEKEFWSMPLMVSPATLVPRPETELLVEQALGFLPRRQALRVLDLGTGSGAVALALARERPLCHVTATDISADALAIARENARQLDLANVTFELGDWLDAVGDRSFDVIVSNPPYVAEQDPAFEGLRHEPRSALASGPDGLDDIRRIVPAAFAHCAPCGCLLIEHGADQADAVAAVFAAAGWRRITNVRDYAGKPRVTLGRRIESA